MVYTWYIPTIIYLIRVPDVGLPQAQSLEAASLSCQCALALRTGKRATGCQFLLSSNMLWAYTSEKFILPTAKKFVPCIIPQPLVRVLTMV